MVAPEPLAFEGAATVTVQDSAVGGQLELTLLLSPVAVTLRPSVKSLNVNVALLGTAKALRGWSSVSPKETIKRLERFIFTVPSRRSFPPLRSNNHAAIVSGQESSCNQYVGKLRYLARFALRRDV